MKEVTPPPASSPEGMEKKEVPSCLKHPGEKQLQDDQGRPSGLCPLCLPLQKVQAARPGVEAPPLADSNSGANAAPRCPKHPEKPQRQNKRGDYMGMCLICLQERPRRNAKARKEELQALRQAAPPGGPPGAEINLLGKLPDFDPAWPDDLKNKWFDVFKELISLGSPNGGTGEAPSKQASKQEFSL